MNGQRGFTLVEILVAVAIIAVVLSSVYGVYAAAETGRQRAEMKSAALHLGRVLFDRLERELLGLATTGVNEDIPVLAGQAVDNGYQLTLLTLAGAGPANGLRQIRWQTRARQQQSELTRVDQPWPPPGGDETFVVLDDRIADFSVRFWQRGSWRENWDSRRDGLPDLVELKLTVQAGDRPVALRSAVRLPTEERF